MSLPEPLPPAAPAVEAADAAETQARAPLSWSRIFWQRFRRNRLAVAGMVVLLILYGAMAFASQLAPYDPNQLLVGPTNAGPSAEHWMGTDHLGRDLFSRVLAASRVSLNIGLLVAVVSVGIGTAVGAVAGYFGGWVDEVLMRFTEVIMTFPFLFLAITVVALFGAGFWTIVVVLGVLSWTPIARIVRASFLSLREREFVEGARAIGVPAWRIVTRHLLPNSLAPIIVFATLVVGAAILAESSLSYLGLGVQPPATSWGQLLYDGKQYMQTNLWYTFFPGLMIFITVMAINFVGDGLRDALDPRLKE